MKTLSIKACQPFIEYVEKHITTVGFMRIMHDFINTSSGVLRDAVRSWYRNLVEGQSMQTALVMMHPKFPPPLEAFLIHAIEQSILDLALQKLVTVYHAATTEEDLLYDVSRIYSSATFRSSSEGICHECFTREFNKLVARAVLEEAYEVILEQEGEAFFHQKYLGSKLVHYKEPCHSKVYQTFRHSITDAAQNSGHILIGQDTWHVAHEHDETFIMKHEKTRVRVTFPEK